MSRWDILNVVRSTPGFVSFSMSEPLKTYNFVRYGWVSYDSEENCRAAKSILEKTNLPDSDFNLSPIKS